MLWILPLLLVPIPEIPIEVSPLVSVHQATSDLEALALVEPLVEQRLDEDPEGLHYLYGHLLERVGRDREASDAFAQSIAYTRQLEQHSRLRLARMESRRGHPEVTAGLAASILRARPHPALVAETTRLLVASIRQGGDCRLLSALEPTQLPDDQRRALSVTRAQCDLKVGPSPAVLQQLIELLEENENDDAARIAADLLFQQEGTEQLPNIERHLGRTFSHHRRFDRAIEFLQAAVDQLPSEIHRSDDFDLYYLLARSHFRKEDFPTAAKTFVALAQRTVEPRSQAKAFYQAARSKELHGDWTEARSLFARAATITPSSSWTGPAILSALRLDWRRGLEKEALGTYATLRSRSSWNAYASHAALFLASSDLVQGRTDRAGNWLAQAANRRADRATVRYWQGRLAEDEGRLDDAVQLYSSLIVSYYFHPLADSARERLQSPHLNEAVDRSINSNRSSSEFSTLAAVWALASLGDPLAPSLRQRLRENLAQSSSTATFIGLAPASATVWPLWTASPQRLDKLLLSLGRWDEVERNAILRLFPTKEPELAFAAARELAKSGATRSSLYIAESLHQRIPKRIPEPLLPLEFRQTLYPLAHLDEVLSTSRHSAVDVHLLLSIIREESRFDPYALSSAAARGLTQFILPTANRIATELGLQSPIDPDELYVPAVSIKLGATYLSELDVEFGGNFAASVAAYNAGIDQAHLWSAYCFSSDDAEYFTKVGFKETRAYLERVLTSKAQYLDLYPRLGD